jgi:hypothetical protein
MSFGSSLFRHCEEPQAMWQSRAVMNDALDCFAVLAMTKDFCRHE